MKVKGNKMKDYCIVCGSQLKIETKKNLAHGMGTVTVISGRSLREIICLIFPNDEELQVMLRVAESDPEFPANPEQGPAVCHACYNLVEQIDAFEMHLNRTRESLVLRRDKKVANGTVTTAPSTSRRGAVSLTSTLNLEALSQLPPTTRIEAILKVEPEDDNNFANDDYFPDIIDEDFLLDVPFNNTIKKEFSDSGWSSSNQDLVKEPDAEYDSDDKQKDEDYVPPTKTKKTREKREKVVKPTPPAKKVTAGYAKISFQKSALGAPKLRVPIINFAAVPDMMLEPDPTKTTELMAEIETDEQREAVKDFESDIQFLKTILPMEIANQANSDSWLQYLLRSESDLVYSGVVGELKCFECDWKFRSVGLKLSHVIKMHSGKNIKPYSCEQCESTEFINEDDAFNHVCNEHDIKAVNGRGIRGPRLSGESSSVKLYCNHCAVVSSTELAYWFHFWTRHKMYTDAKCRFCPDAPGSAVELRRHVLLNHLGYKFVCEQPECDFQAKTTEAMLVHVKSHIEGDEVALDVIGTKGATIGKMKRKNGDDDDIDGEADEDVEAKYVGRKPDEQLSHYARRSREMKPLSIYERVNINCDQYLVESSASAAALKLVPHLHKALDEQIQLLKTMPNIITTQEESVSWDVALLRSEATKLTFGIPGENKCFKCDATTKNPADKHYHILSVHGAGQHDESYRCSHCPSKGWSSEEAAFHHSKAKHMNVWNQDKGEKREPIVLSDGGLKCRYCTIVSSSELAFWVHTMARHKRFKQIRCEMCSQLCCNGPQFRRHVLIHHGQYRYKCPECPKSFRPIDSFRYHVKEHERIKLIDDYEKKKADRIAKGLPLSIIEDEKPPEPFPKRSKKLPAEFLTCELCGKESRGEKFHAKHLFTVHGIEKKMSCTECGKECSSIRVLEAHRRSEHSVASCHFCGKSFFSSQHLTSHLRQVHEVGAKDDDYICEICATTFSTKAYLRIHMRTHREKHIKCQLCPKMFRWESALRSHMAAAHTETNQIIHQCEYCGKQFKDKSNLKSHRYTHLDVKPHSCSKCGRGFIRRDMMLTHEKNCRL